MSIPLADAILIVEKIHHGHKDRTTGDLRFLPLWRYPILQEVLLTLLQGVDRGTLSDLDWANFHIVCDTVSPDFANILAQITLEDGTDLTNPPAAIYQTVEPDTVASNLSQVTIC
jgi:hypothetical protein